MTVRPAQLVFPATGLLWLAAVAVSPDTGRMSAADRYAGIEPHQTALGVASLLFVLAGIGVAGCGVTAVRQRPEGPGAGALRIGAGLLAAASAWLVLAYGAFYAGVLALLQQHASRATVYRFVDDGAGHPWSHLFDLTLLAFFVAPIVVAAGLWRAGRAGWLPLALWVVGFVADGAFEFSVRAGAIAGVAVCAVALTLLGRALDPTSEAEPARHPVEPRPTRVGV